MDNLSQSKQSPPEEVITLKARVKKKDIGFINFITDIYDGYANLRTIDARQGLIEFWVAPDFVDEFKSLLDRLKKFLRYGKGNFYMY